jgi:Ni,Fe-hydrogenase I large subunit
MIVKKLIEKIEGEAELDFSLKNNRVEDVKIKYGFSRGIENILVGKAPRDALVITPRVCGICNHAHLIASVKALEDGYQKAGVEAKLTKKAEDIREFTLACELIQNHIKWLYLTIVPQLERLTSVLNHQNHAIKASYLSSTITKALAIFAGQWPHSSYAVPFGVTCDPTFVDIIEAENIIDEAIKFFEQVVVGMKLDDILSINSVIELPKIGGDFGKVISMILSNNLADKGKSHGRFIVFGDSLSFKRGKSVPTQISNIKVRFIKESSQIDTVAKAITYKNKHYEMGPLARGMITKEPIIKNLHKRYKDSLLTRVFARVYEVAILLDYNKKLLSNLDINEASCTLDSDFKIDNFEGVGIVEAARGSLIHKTKVKEGLIKEYQIIVPTQWNLAQGDKNEQGVAIKAMIGSKNIEEATLIFRSFDVCSVCTLK